MSMHLSSLPVLSSCTSGNGKMRSSSRGPHRQKFGVQSRLCWAWHHGAGAAVPEDGEFVFGHLRCAALGCPCGRGVPRSQSGWVGRRLRSSCYMNSMLINACWKKDFLANKSEWWKGYIFFAGCDGRVQESCVEVPRVVFGRVLPKRTTTTRCALLFLGDQFCSDLNGRPAMAERGSEGGGTGSARRRRERRLRSMLRHKRMAVAMAVAEATHHSSRGQKTATAIREEVVQATHDATSGTIARRVCLLWH